MTLKVFIGYDPREPLSYKVAEASLRKHASISVDVQPIILEHVRAQGLYTRPTSRRDGSLWDDISDAPMSTEFALSRFLVPALAGWKDWALFCDADFLFRADVFRLQAYMDPKFAVCCVPHFHTPPELTKMDGQKQTNYARKNWSSFILWNCGHLKHAGQVDRVNRWPGLWLHQFRWLEFTDIGRVDPSWNVLDDGREPILDVSAYHMTRGTPELPGYESIPFADEWRSYATA